MGGGIFIGAGLKAGWQELQRSVAGTRHLLLFADADDSEEPADYRETLKEMVKEGATVSVIALGTEKSADAGLLREIAELGRGRIFFCDRPGDIPSIFAQETVSVRPAPSSGNAPSCAARLAGFKLQPASRNGPLP